MIQSFISEIQKFNQTYDFNLLRRVLGEISVYLNKISLIFKDGNRSPSLEVAKEAQEILIDFENGQFNQLHKSLNQLHESLNSINTQDLNKKNIVNLVHTLQRKQLNEQQIEMLKKIAHFDPSSANFGFREETNKRGLDQHLKSSVYNLKTPKDKTLRVIREVLQNSVDATDPHKHTHLNANPKFKPEILITTYDINDDLMDIIVEDKGIGMDWDILSKKFFVTFESGKNDDSNAAGGFGIAKALIQDTPEHGWSIDTNNLHTSRFHKNIYFGTSVNQTYEVPRSEIKKTGDGGVTLSLFGVPYVYSYDIERLCSIYASNGRVDIILNGEKITPKFTLNSENIKSLNTNNLSILSSVVTKDKSGEDVANNILDKMKDGIEEKLGDVSDHTGNLTDVKFFLNEVSSWGKLYVMVNGQYQFDKEFYIEKMDIICSLTTKARPGTDEYPLDPGRSYVRDPLGPKIDRVVESVKEFARKVVENDVIKEGLDFSIVNPDSEPMNTIDPEIGNKIDNMAQTILINLDDAMDQSSEEKEEKIKQSIEAFTKRSGLTSDEATINAMVRDLAGKEKIDVSDVKKALEGLTTTGAIIVQKNYVAKKWTDNNIDVTAEMMIIWQRTLKILVDKLVSSGRYGKKIRKRQFIPGLIFSSECLGLYLPSNEEIGRKFPTVCVNPMLLAASVNPKAFYSKVNGEDFGDAVRNEDNGDDEKSSKNSDTPINRLAKSFFHIGTHELCHLLFPDSYGSEEFHNNITFIEILCHDCIDDVKQEIKPMMKRLRGNANRMINQIGKNKKNESYIWIRESFSDYLNNKLFLIKEITVKNHLKINTNTFKNWLFFQENRL